MSPCVSADVSADAKVTSDQVAAKATMPAAGATVTAAP